MPEDGVALEKTCAALWKHNAQLRSDKTVKALLQLRSLNKDGDE